MRGERGSPVPQGTSVCPCQVSLSGGAGRSTRTQRRRMGDAIRSLGASSTKQCGRPTSHRPERRFLLPSAYSSIGSQFSTPRVSAQPLDSRPRPCLVSPYSTASPDVQDLTAAPGCASPVRRFTGVKALRAPPLSQNTCPGMSVAIPYSAAPVASSLVTHAACQLARLCCGAACKSCRHLDIPRSVWYARTHVRLSASLGVPGVERRRAAGACVGSQAVVQWLQVGRLARPAE